MTYRTIRAAQQAGIKIGLNPEGGIRVKGNPKIVEIWIPLIQAEKDSIIRCLRSLWINPYCDELIFTQFGNQMASEKGLKRVLELHQKALAIGVPETQAWDFAEAVAVIEFSGDERRVCLECKNYQHIEGSDHGVCAASRTLLIQNHTHRISVNWDWLDRCHAHTENLDKSKIIESNVR